VDFDAYSSKQPQRGDLVMIEHGPDRTSYIKRVAGIAGDAISSGNNGEVLVNGESLRYRPLCGSPVRAEHSAEPPYVFATTVVPPNSLFVVGDNLSASKDSRWQEFGGPIRIGEVRGKPLFIDCSPGHSRFACQVR
jgi:signal peptidase I